MSGPRESSSDRKNGWLFGLDAGSRPRGVEHDHTGGILGPSGVDSTGVTRFRLYVFKEADLSMAVSAMTELLNEIDPIR
jgi:hypothetical protein